MMIEVTRGIVAFTQCIVFTTACTPTSLKFHSHTDRNEEFTGESFRRFGGPLVILCRTVDPLFVPDATRKRYGSIPEKWIEKII